MFERVSKRDFVIWNVMICGYVYYGFVEEVFRVFEEMKIENVKSNYVIFVVVFRVCGYMGLVEKGWDYFCSMCSYGLDF